MIVTFKNQVAVVSGAADGLGKAISERLAGEGVIIALFDINPVKLEETVNTFLALGYKSKGWLVDVCDESSVLEAYNDVKLEFGKIDIMINSAGVVGPTSTPILNYKTEDFDHVYQVNLRGAFLMTKYAIANMVDNGYGRILLIASIAGKEGNPNMVGYSATKAGVIGLVKAIAKEFAEVGVIINGLAPAVIKTAMNEDTSKEQLDYMISKIPMRRLGTVDEVAEMAKFIVSPENSFSTGFIYDISGGRATY